MKRNSLLALALALALSACAPIQPRAVEPREYVYSLTYIASPAPIVPIRTDKKGIGLTYGNAIDATNAGASWCFNWSINGDCGDAEFVPMAWCGVPSALPSETETLLTANEPDRDDQCNQSPEVYAETYRAIEEKFPNVNLVAPSISQLGFEWLEQFRAAYITRYGNPPRMDALAIHCYATIAQGCIDITERAIMLADAFDIESVWVTEIALLACADGIDFLNEARTLLEWLEDNPRVARYAWFAARIRGNEWWSMPSQCIAPLFDFETGRHTAIGELYAEVK
jgi:hypothetical protein